MSVFGSYAQYYDLLYRDKDYAGETDFVCGLMARHVPGVQSVLELGCGTGGHAEYLARAGLRVHGIDISNDMLELARERHRGLERELAERIRFEQGNAHALSLSGKYDAVLALFHVMSYQTSNQDLLATVETARKHLADGGVFIFDFWYGPGVLMDRPEIRVKRMQGDTCSVLRIAEPEMHPNDNLVDVNYHIVVKNMESNVTEEHQERHRMRYLFLPEIEHYLSCTGFRLVEFGEWMSGEDPGFGSWSVYCVAKCIE